MKNAQINPAVGISASGFSQTGSYLISYNQSFATGTVRIYGDYLVTGSTLTLDYAAETYTGAGDANKPKSLYFGPANSSFNNGRSKITIDSTGGFHAVGQSAGANPTLIDMLPGSGTYYTFVDSGVFTIQYASMTDMDESGLQLNGSGPFSINNSSFDYSGNGAISTSTLFSLNGVTQSTISLTSVYYGNSRVNGTNYNYTISGSSTGLQWTNNLWSGALGGAANSQDDQTQQHILWGLDATPPGISTGVVAYQSGSSNTVTVSWVMPGDNGYSGALGAGSQFAIQYSSNIAAVVWSTASAQVVVSTSGVTPGAVVAYNVSPSTNAFYYFSVWTQDPSGNWSVQSSTAGAYNSPFSFETVDNNAGSFAWTSLAIDKDGNLHLAYINGAGSAGLCQAYNRRLGQPGRGGCLRQPASRSGCRCQRFAVDFLRSE